MAAAKDIMLDENNRLIIVNGDYKVDYSDGQHTKLLLFTTPGAWRQYPLAGVGIRRAINAKNPAGTLSLRRDILMQLTADGMRVKKLGLSNGKLLIDSERI